MLIQLQFKFKMEPIQYFMNVWKKNQPSFLAEADRLIEKHQLFEKENIMEHQKQGIRQMISLYIGGRNAYLGDEMGLGKTLQCIKIIQFYVKNTSYLHQKPCLVITPNTLQSNWQKQIQKFSSKLSVVCLSSKQEDRKRFTKIIKERRAQVIIVNYRICMYEYIVCRNKYGIVVLDEAQAAKNNLTKLSQLMLSISSKMNIFVTGTPLSNSVDEVMNQLILLQPNLFLSRPQISMEEVKDIMNFFIIRRTKLQIQQISLPKKNQKVIYKKLTDIQTDLYKKVATEDTFDLQNITSNQMTNLMKICDHPFLEQVCEHDFNDEDKLVNSSTKMIELQRILRQHIDRKERVIIFHQLLKVGRAIINLCKMKGYSYCLFNGTVDSQRKQQQLSKFHKQHVDVFISTTKSGGTGLTLVQANIIVLFNTSWNPQVDHQAIDRVHRVGQIKDVTIYRLICQGTVEERMLNFQSNKLELQQKLIKINRHDKIFRKGDEQKKQSFENQVIDWGPKVNKRRAAQVVATRLRPRTRSTVSQKSQAQTEVVKDDVGGDPMPQS